MESVGNKKTYTPRELPSLPDRTRSHSNDADHDRLMKLEGFVKETREMLLVMSENIETLLIAAKENPVRARRSIDRSLRRSTSISDRRSSDPRRISVGSKYHTAPQLSRVDSTRRKSFSIDLGSVAKWSHAAGLNCQSYPLASIFCNCYCHTCPLPSILPSDHSEIRAGI
jgi:hypothetical protein